MTKMLEILITFGLVAFINSCDAFSAVSPVENSIKGFDIQLQPVDGGEKITLENYLKNDGKSLFVFGTYAADFNAIEYAQRLRYYLPILKEECDVTKFGVILNCQPDAALALAELVDLDTTKVDLFVDNTGDIGRKWGVGRGWLPDEDLNPYLKLFGMLWGVSRTVFFVPVNSPKLLICLFQISLAWSVGDVAGRNRWIHRESFCTTKMD